MRLKDFGTHPSMGAGVGIRVRVSHGWPKRAVIPEEEEEKEREEKQELD